MVHPAGNITYDPQADYTFPRSYIQYLRWTIESNLVYTQTGSLFTFQYTPLPSLRAYVKLRDDFWQWSSASWHLNTVVEYAYEKVNPGAPETDVTLTVRFRYSPDLLRHELQIDTVFPFLLSYVQLPPRDRPYWLPDPPPPP